MMRSCPYCNHEFQAAASRSACPRCGETVPTRGPAAEPGAAFDAPRVAPSLGDAVKSRLKFALLATLLIVVVIGGTVAKYYLDERRKKQQPPAPISAAAVHPPLQLRALEHLPPDVNLVVAIQPGPIAAAAEKEHQDPVALLTQNGIPGSVFSSLARAGITLQQVDHAAIGIHVPGAGEELRLCVALVFRQALPDEAAFLRQLQAKPAGPPGRFEVQFDKLPIQMARVSETLWLFGLGDKDLAGASGSRLAADFQEVIGRRVPSDAVLWAAAAPTAWSDKPILKALKKDWLKLVASQRAAAIAFIEPGRLSVALQSDAPEDAEKRRRFFKSRATGEHSSAGGEGNWATLSIPVEPKNVAATLTDLANGLPP